MKLSDIPAGAFIQSSAPESQRKIITKTKTLGSPSGDDMPRKESKKIVDEQALLQKKEHEAHSEQRAQKAKSEILDKAGAMRHLRYDVIEEADMVQVSVINNSDGAIVRKFPPDKVIDIVIKIREKRRRSKKSLDLKA